MGAHFDESRQIEVSGRVVEFKLRSPHATLIVTGVAAIDGILQGDHEERWEIESISLPGLRRMGVKADTFKAGDIITVVGSPHRKPGFRFVHSATFFTGDGEEYRLKIQKPEKVELTEQVSAATGVYRLAGRWRGPLAKLPERSPMPLNQAGLSAWQNFEPKLSPANTCEPVSIPNAYHTPYLFDVAFAGDEVILRNQIYDITRHIKLDTEYLAAEPSGRFGEARAKFDGEILIVESRNYPPSGWGAGRGNDPACRRGGYSLQQGENSSGKILGYHGCPKADRNLRSP